MILAAIVDDDDRATTPKYITIVEPDPDPPLQAIPGTDIPEPDPDGGGGSG